MQTAVKKHAMPCAINIIHNSYVNVIIRFIVYVYMAQVGGKALMNAIEALHEPLTFIQAQHSHDALLT